MINVILKKKNGVVELISKPSQEIIDKEKSYQHLCWDCDNYEKCPKILTIKKQNIGKYPFILDGNQIISDTGELENFIVSRCRNFQRTMPGPQTKAEQEIAYKKAKIAREELRKIYFNVDTTEEANNIQFYDLDNGLIKDIHGKKPYNPNNSKIKIRKR